MSAPKEDMTVALQKKEIKENSDSFYGDKINLAHATEGSFVLAFNAYLNDFSMQS
jgi:hypothetical protein